MSEYEEKMLKNAELQTESLSTIKATLIVILGGLAVSFGALFAMA